MGDDFEIVMDGEFEEFKQKMKDRSRIPKFW